MARVEIPTVVLNPSTGLPVNGAAVVITRRGTGAAVTWWSAETGGTSSTAALVTDANGRVNGWVDRGAYNLAITGSGITGYTEPWDAIPGSDASLDPLLFADGSIPKAKLATAVQESLVPVGAVLPTIAAAAPTGFLLCDGTAVSRSTYATLYASIGDAYGAGDGSTTFNVPNMKGRVPVGYDATQTEFNLLGKSGGAKTHLLTSSESGMPTHGHADTFAVANAGAINTGTESADHAHNITGYGTTRQGGTGVAVGFPGTDGLPGTFTTSGRTVAHVHTLPAHGHVLNGAVTNATGVNAAAAHNNLQPYLVFNYIIKT